MTNPIGTRVLPRVESGLSPELFVAFQALGVAQVSDCMGRLYGSRGLRPFHGSRRMAGVALTVKARAGDNLLIHQALQISRPGDVIVVDGAGCTANALVGELMMTQAMARGVQGFVIDGAIRDADAFVAADFPCFARATAHRGPYKDGPGEVNVPVSVGGLVVSPGDLVLGDGDGVLAIPAAHAERILALSQQKGEAEQAAMARIRSGDLGKPWLAPALQRMNEEWT